MTGPTPRVAGPLAVTMGEPAGIGGELTLAAWSRRETAGVPPFFAIDCPERLATLARHLGLSVPVRVIEAAQEASSVWAQALPVLPEPLPVPVVPGQPDPANGPAVRGSIERAVGLTRSGEAAAVVTNPIHKAVLYKSGFTHPGHTEWLAELAGPGHRSVMMLVGADLRVVPVTVHVSLANAIASLTIESIVEVGRIVAKALGSDFGIDTPRLAVAGLNPHAGEHGTMGEEDDAIIAPAVEALRAEGWHVSGPLSADTMFHAAARQGYDAALCMYHDQALIPVKTLAFDSGVNVTLNLPFVRTSPDHGTAFGIAGRGEASPTSFLAALDLAANMAARRGTTWRTR